MKMQTKREQNVNKNIEDQNNVRLSKFSDPMTHSGLPSHITEYLAIWERKDLRKCLEKEDPNKFK